VHLTVWAWPLLDGCPAAARRLPNADKETTMDENDPDIQACLEACAECSSVCRQHVKHCLELGEDHADPAHIGMLLTCATVCDATAQLVSLDSEWHPTLADVCSQVCDECAESCEELDEMESCVEACRACAEACRAMVESVGESAEADDDEEESPVAETMN
jgi:hypothetical protein